MDKNQVTGLILISVILIAYLQFFAPEPQQNLPEANTTSTVIDSTNNKSLENAIENKVQNIPDSLISKENQEKYSVFAPFITTESDLITVENNTSKFIFSTKGGVLEQVELKKYTTYRKKPLILFDAVSHKEKLIVQLNSGSEIDINSLQFKASSSGFEVGENDKTKTLSFKVEISENQYIIKEYIIHSDNYQVKQKLSFKGFDNILSSNKVDVNITDRARHFEKDIKQSRNRSIVTYLTLDDDFDDFGERSSDDFDEELTDIKWFSFKQKFFTKAYIYEDGLKSAKIGLYLENEDTNYTKKYTANYTLDISKGDVNSIIYLGPNKYDILEDVGYDLGKNVYLGWSIFRLVNEYLILPLFNFLTSIFGNYGLIIFLLVLVIKTAIFPFTFKSYKGFAKMKVLKPELDALKEECGDDQTKYQQEQMKVYQKFGVSPLSGCIPLLFQMPFLLALFQLFPNLIELRGKSFLWAEDLSTYDAIFTWGAEIPLLGNHISLFTMLMTVSTIAYTYISQQMTPTATAPGQPNMKVISYMMPLVFFFVLNDYASGLTYYYFLSNIITIGQQLISKKFIDEEKILAKMKAYSEKSKGKKKSTFSKRLEEAMKAQQEKQKNKK